MRVPPRIVSDISGLGGCVQDRAGLEAHVVGPAEVRGYGSVAIARLLAQVDPDELDVPSLAEVAISREGQVGVAAPEVDDRQRTVGRQARVVHRSTGQPGYTVRERTT